MDDRKYALPNNGVNLNPRMKAFQQSEIYIKYPKNGERQSSFSHAREGRAVSEGTYGGGYRISK
jgi:hypothetical protein